MQYLTFPGLQLIYSPVYCLVPGRLLSQHLVLRTSKREREREGEGERERAVSYTHLTLPTTAEV